ncbi:phBC6A51 family helix-turn-helix protein [Neobacillus mesonae]|uniref:phBC6A51 family helix-turn-helix protein n=1 Tax=Neobacillus mesonae TaxID=1193713 RepID=UPI002573ED26|nr:phBC6A51 family helix-turn-helix protein [Neobacillus mesonae]
MLSAQQLKAIELLSDAELSVKAISEHPEVNCSRTTLYSWMKLEEFQEKLTELNELRDKLLKDAVNKRVHLYIDRMEKLSDKSKNEQTKFNATKTLLAYAGWNSEVQDINIKDDRQQDNKNELMEMWRKKKAGNV